MRVFPLFLSSSCLVMLNLLFVDIAYSFLPGLSSSWSFGRVLTANTIQYSLKNQPFPLRNNDFILSAINGGADSLSNSNSKAKLLNDPNPNSIGNFFENKTEDTSFIQCYMLALGEVQGTQYGVGKENVSYLKIY